MRTTALLGAALAAALLTGCSDGDPGDGSEVGQEPTTSTSGEPTEAGGDDFLDQEPAEIVAAAQDAMAGLQSVRMAGGMTNDGQRLDLDVAMSKDGSCSGSITVDGGTFSVIGVGGEMWFQADEAFWTANAGDQAATIIDLIDGRWVVVPPDDDSFAEFCNLEEFLGEVVSDDGDDDVYELGEVTDVDGVEAVGVVNTTEDGGPSTGYVQVEGEHYLLRMVREEGDEPGDISFSAFDEPVVASAPAPEDTVDLDQLGG